MSFNISLQYTTSDPRMLTKDIVDIITLTGDLRDKTSIINPVIIVEADLSILSRCNYMTIDSFNRKYFINDITSVNTDLVEISAHVDVLTTYANDIRRNNAIIRKQANDYNLYLNDDSLKVYQNPKVITKVFPSGFSTQEFVLAIAGS